MQNKIRKANWMAGLIFIGVSPLMMGSQNADAQDLPPPDKFISSLDLTCHRVAGDIQPPVDDLIVGHLNPVLQKMGFEEEYVKLHEMEQLCVPVAKNDVYPPSPIDEYLRWIDLACYQAVSDRPQQVALGLDHLNPVLQRMGLPSEEVFMVELDQLCVPVMKNGAAPPASVRWLVEHVDVACYDIEPLGEFKPFGLHLTHLNPVLQKMGLKDQDIVAYKPRQLCVPVMKNNQAPPDDALRFIQLIDFEKYAVDFLGVTPPIQLKLRHLNPLFQEIPEFVVEMLENEELAVPVAKKPLPEDEPDFAYLDLTCHKVEGDVRPPVDALTVRHLNPVLREMGFEEERIKLREMDQLCVPVAKNDVYPPPETEEYVRWIDLACYRADSEISMQAALRLDHLNPVLQEMGLPTEEVLMFRFNQLCVPVVKNGVAPPDSVRWLVEHVDVACYDIEPLGDFKPFDLHLTHLNPVLQKLGLMEQDIFAYKPVKLCVPVMKNDQVPPPDALAYIQWIDFEKYAVDPLGDTLPIPLTLRHLNPLFQNGEEFFIEMLENQELAVPVAKNGQFPPLYF